MAIFFQDGLAIPEITIQGLNTLSRDIRVNQRKLSAGLLTDSDDDSFTELYLSWFKACVDFMYYISHDKEKNYMEAPNEEHLRVIALFQKGADESECKGFLHSYQTMLTIPGYPNVGNKERARSICDRLSQKMQGIAPYLYLRAAVVCLLTNSMPEEVFAEGEGWADVLCAAAITVKYETNIHQVKEGDTFILDLDVDLSQGQLLIPKTLQNDSSRICTISVIYEGAGYLIKLPPYGTLRAVFSDNSCTKLAGVKGNISCCDSGSAIVQKSDEDGMKLLYIDKRSRVVEYPQAGLFWDASADEMGGITGAVILGTDELYSTVDSSINLQRGGRTELPIRCYRSGNQWAWLYADGRLVSNLEKQADLSGVTAVVEDAVRGLLVCKQEGAIDYRDNLKKKISKSEFAQVMLNHFPQEEDGDCEVQATQFIKWVIRSSGKLEGVK